MTKLEAKIDDLINENRELKQTLELLLKKINELQNTPPVINNYYYNQEPQSPYLTPPYVINHPFINTQPNGTGNPNHFPTFTTSSSNTSELFLS